MSENKMNADAARPGASPLIEMAGRFSIEPTKLLEVMRGTIIKPDRNGKQATNEEVAAFCIVANQYGLNPFTREIHAFTDGQRGVVPIVGIDGWTHVVNARDNFNGCVFEDVADASGAPVSVTCRIFVKGREHPVAVTERFSECKRNTIPWQTMPWRMLRHKAYMQAARYAFGLSGIYDEDEARDIAKSAAPASPKPILPRPVFVAASPLMDAGPATVPPVEDIEDAAKDADADLSPVPFEVDTEDEKFMRGNVIEAIQTATSGLPRRLAKACQKFGIDKDQLATAPIEGLRKVLAEVEAEGSR